MPPPEGLSDFECPESAEHIWHWFLEISRRRGNNGFGANPISYAEVDAWARLTHTRPSALEVEWITDLDDARAAATAADKPPPVQRAAPQSKKTN